VQADFKGWQPSFGDDGLGFPWVDEQKPTPFCEVVPAMGNFQKMAFLPKPGVAAPQLAVGDDPKSPWK